MKTKILKHIAFIFVIITAAWGANSPPSVTPAQAAAIQEVVNSIAEPENYYHIKDMGRDGQLVAILYSKRPLATNDLIYIGDDIWKVIMIQIVTQPSTPEIPNSALRFYKLQGTSIGVEFYGKAKK